MQRRTKIGVVLGVVAIAILAFALNLGTSVQVSIRNLGPNPMRKVIVHVTGAYYALGDIEPGGSTSTSVIPTGESHVDIRFVDSTGTPRWLIGDCYIEPNYGGSIHFDVKSGQIVAVDDNIRLLRWWLPIR